jgi:hypothetical protein
MTMTPLRYRLIAILAVVTCLAVSSVQAGPKKVKAYDSQTSHTFANVEQTTAQGLHIVLTADAIVVTDDQTGAAGPFRNVRGNGSTTIILTNAESPIAAAGGDGSSVPLVFRSYKSKLAIKTWWWLDEKGKRIGKKQKG